MAVMKNHDFPVELAVTRGLSHNPFSKVNLLNFRVFPSIGANIEIMTEGNKEIRVPPATRTHNFSLVSHCLKIVKNSY